MKPDISEFSYGYALTEAFVWDSGLPVVGAPIFPSLIDEEKNRASASHISKACKYKKQIDQMVYEL